ncbi:MAG: hypothetical protein ACLT98_12945 [Eggerthellaceae bacterium]
MPSTRSLGYALFLAVNATAVWAACSVPSHEHSNELVHVAFFLAQSLVSP